MTRLIISAPIASRSLGFDLPEILAALGPGVAGCTWGIRDLNYISEVDEDVPVLERGLVEPVSGSDLLSGLGALTQVIDGRFSAVDGAGTPWVTLLAVDSSWWEVESEDATALESIRHRFTNVEQQP